jgi:immunity protein 53 of polymorphic toxin system
VRDSVDGARDSDFMHDTLRRFQNWYQAHCNGDWEHHAGVTIDTLDNPGWSVRIHLTGMSSVLD